LCRVLPGPALSQCGNGLHPWVRRPETDRSSAGVGVQRGDSVLAVLRRWDSYHQCRCRRPRWLSATGHPCDGRTSRRNEPTQAPACPYPARLACRRGRHRRVGRPPLSRGNSMLGVVVHVRREMVCCSSGRKSRLGKGRPGRAAIATSVEATKPSEPGN